LKLETVADLRG